jgi:DNA-binding response OmpR family regulator
MLMLLLVEDDLEDQQLLYEDLLEIEARRQWSNWHSSLIVPIDTLSCASECLRRETFDAILLNLSLPDSPTLLDSFLEVTACAGSTPILVLADEPDEHLANRLLREGAQDFLVKSELDCGTLARAVRYAIERQRRVKAAHASAFVDNLTGVLTREAFLNVAAHRARGEFLTVIEITAHREALDPLLIQAAQALRIGFPASSMIGRWDQHRLCVITSGLVESTVETVLDRAFGTSAFWFSFSLLDSDLNLEEILTEKLRPRAKTAMLAD